MFEMSFGPFGNDRQTRADMVIFESRKDFLALICAVVHKFFERKL